MSSTTLSNTDRSSSSDEADEAGRSPRSGNGNNNNGRDSSGPSRPPYQDQDHEHQGHGQAGDPSSGSPAKYAIIYPKKTSLKRRLRVKDEDHLFLDFVTALLHVDPTLRYVREHLRLGVEPLLLCACGKREPKEAGVFVHGVFVISSRTFVLEGLPTRYYRSIPSVRFGCFRLVVGWLRAGFFASFATSPAFSLLARGTRPTAVLASSQGVCFRVLLKPIVPGRVDFLGVCSLVHGGWVRCALATHAVVARPNTSDPITPGQRVSTGLSPHAKTRSSERREAAGESQDRYAIAFHERSQRHPHIPILRAVLSRCFFRFIRFFRFLSSLPSVFVFSASFGDHSVRLSSPKPPTLENHDDRPTAEEALSHPWILSGLAYSDDELWYPPDEDNAVRHDEHDGADDEECDGDGVGVVIEEYVGVGGIARVEGQVAGEVGGEEVVVSPRRRSV